ncbi:hypothetical protein GYH30_033587 [Glycine max]|uniref:Uncharacterized protein n=1 Tax=Glycine max TaxID=3847 RepID=A0A0R0HH69_SOYBN|nr:hypothetical protein GYH30_033587 [Glycine max]
MNTDFVGIDPTQDDPMVVTIVLVGWIVQRTLIDQGSSTKILYWSIFEKLDVSHDLIKPHEKFVIGFVGKQVYARGKINLLTTFDSSKLSQSLTVPYVLVDANTSCNVLLSRPTLIKLRAIISIPHLAMKYPSSIGEIVTVKAYHIDACECYVKSYKIEPYNMVKEKKNKYKNLQ